MYPVCGLIRYTKSIATPIAITTVTSVAVNIRLQKVLLDFTRCSMYGIDDWFIVRLSTTLARWHRQSIGLFPSVLKRTITRWLCPNTMVRLAVTRSTRMPVQPAGCRTVSRLRRWTATMTTGKLATVLLMLAVGGTITVHHLV
jgi:hypothetical protein